MTETTKKLRSRVHISYKPQEYGLLDQEEDLMKHFCMNRSDVHKHLIRTAWDQVFGYGSSLSPSEVKNYPYKRSTND